jgi:tRNA(fMet)-specific endonuclease VapC
MELEFGLALDPARARRIRPAVEALLDSIAVDLTPADARAAATVRAALERRGRPVGPYDILIAGVALARGLVLVTANTREFARIDGLTVETWR